MTANIKAVVFKTDRLAATRSFFENTLQLQVNESSARHFVIHSKSVRLVFVETQGSFELELYVNGDSVRGAGAVAAGSAATDFTCCKDPNGISIVITEHQLNKKNTLS